QTRELLLTHAVQWMQDALAALKQTERRGEKFASAGAPSGDLSPAPHGQRNSRTKRPLGYEIETGSASRRPAGLAARNKCLAKKSQARRGKKERRSGERAESAEGAPRQSSAPPQPPRAGQCHPGSDEQMLGTEQQVLKGEQTDQKVDPPE